MFEQVNRNFLRSPLFLLVTFGVLWRVILLFVFDAPAIHSDSRHYIELADLIKTGELFSYEGWRTPGYSLLILLTGGNYTMLIGLQMLMGIVSSLLVYDLIKGYSRKLALCVSLFTSSLLHSIGFEFAVLTEFSSHFFVFLTVWFVVKNKLFYADKKQKLYGVLALLLTFLFLVRPMYIFITPLIAFMMLFHIKKKAVMSGLLKVLIVLLLPFYAYHSWCGLNEKNHGWYTITPFYGINLAQNSHSFFDKLPDEESLLRDIYFKKKDKLGYEKPLPETLREGYNYFFIDTCETNLVWATCGEWGRVNHLEGPEYTHALYDIFRQLILDNPVEYSKAIVRSWIPFWNYSNYLMVDGEFYNPTLTKVIWRMQKLVLLLANLLFLLLAVFSLFSSLKSRKLFTTSTFLIAIVLASSVSQAMVTYGDNSRFAFPTFLIVIVLDAILLYRLYKRESLSF